MKQLENHEIELSEQEAVQMVQETSQLVAAHQANQLSSVAAAAQSSNALSNNVEFWKWLGRNYQNSGIFTSSKSMREFISRSEGSKRWMVKQLQGKGYEWDWMVKQRGNPLKIFNTYDAGDVANRAASDVTERSLLTGKSRDYQMKAYTSKTNPNLTNTSKDITVVTNAEKTAIVEGNGYEKVQSFQDNKTLQKHTEQRLRQIENGKAVPAYTFQNVTGTMAKAGLIGCGVGMGIEAITSYQAFKSGQITGGEYVKEILKAGGDAGLTAGATAGIMVPVSAVLAAGGVSSLITIPVAFVVSGLVNKIIAPCFGRGQYRQILNQAKYYQRLEDCYDDLIFSMQASAEEFYQFTSHMSQQAAIHQALKERSKQLDQDLKQLYDSI